MESLNRFAGGRASPAFTGFSLMHYCAVCTLILITCAVHFPRLKHTNTHADAREHAQLASRHRHHLKCPEALELVNHAFVHQGSITLSAHARRVVRVRVRDCLRRGTGKLPTSGQCARANYADPSYENKPQLSARARAFVRLECRARAAGWVAGGETGIHVGRPCRVANPSARACAGAIARYTALLLFSDAVRDRDREREVHANTLWRL